MAKKRNQSHEKPVLSVRLSPEVTAALKRECERLRISKPAYLELVLRGELPPPAKGVAA